MNTPSSPSFTLTVEAGPGTVRLRLTGDLDYDTSGELAERAEACLTEMPDLRELRLDCAQLRMCDSMGLSTLLMLHRRTADRAIRLYLDRPPAFLERVLEITGIRQLFEREAAPQQGEQAPADEGAATSQLPAVPPRRPTV
ncbi:STAS domain-containing protein [Streptomyces sp. NBC_00388]|uniref:STAS domain-containing protein n=1 Tax=Streptomyces sp. NBC_00388 TaxID=2975735 RepID=UPI002E2198CD